MRVSARSESCAQEPVAITLVSATLGAEVDVLSGFRVQDLEDCQALFDGLVVEEPGNFRLRATGVISGAVAESPPFTVNPSPGVATSLSFRTQPSDTPVDALITPPVRVAILDQFGNVMIVANQNITLAPEPGLTGTLTRTPAGGVASFDDLRISQVGPHRLRASAPGLPDALSAPFEVTAVQVPVATSLSFSAPTSTQPSDVVVGNPITPAVRVSVLDQNGNLFPTNQTVSLALGSNPGGGALQGAAPRAAVNGVVVFDGLSITAPGDGYTLVATGVGLAPGTSIPFNVTPALPPGGPTSLAFRVQPSNVPAGSAITPAVEVEIRDAQGDLVPTATNNITLAIGNNPGGGTLQGVLTRAAVNGIARFDALQITAPGNGYTLMASSGALLGATSNPFNVGPRIQRVSVSSAGAQGDQRSLTAAISADGRFVTFFSEATNLVPGDTNGVGDIFVFDRTTSTAERVSLPDPSVGAAQADGISIRPTISGDGRFVAFSSGQQPGPGGTPTAPTTSSYATACWVPPSGPASRAQASRGTPPAICPPSRSTAAGWPLFPLPPRWCRETPTGPGMPSFAICKPVPPSASAWDLWANRRTVLRPGGWPSPGMAR
ncbi:MAG: PD40 domain-containing protein [Armatimonadetes bacterium]|nr:PD40 domain-containing protein [Armatimonadota bacterium]